jgi:hypothetical protein
MTPTPNPNRGNGGDDSFPERNSVTEPGGAGLQACSSGDTLSRASAPEVHPSAAKAEKNIQLDPGDPGDARTRPANCSG